MIYLLFLEEIQLKFKNWVRQLSIELLILSGRIQTFFPSNRIAMLYYKYNQFKLIVMIPKM